MDLRPYIEHTLLKSGTTEIDIIRHAEEANTYNFLGVCIQPYWIPLIRRYLKPEVRIVTVIGFPLGNQTKRSKVQEAYEAASLGAQEIDMVLNLDALKSGYHAYVQQEIAAVKEHIRPLVLKVIVETHLLTHEEKCYLPRLLIEAGADFIKTSTGFTGGGASLEDVQLFAEKIGSHPLGIKASGGIRHYAQAVTLIEAGASRLGTSQGVTLVTESSPSTENSY